MSVEDELRRRQEQEQLAMQGQPYGLEQGMDSGNLGNIDTALAQQMGTADYAELMRQGTAMQKGAATSHYSPMLDYQKGRFGKDLPDYNYASGQQPGRLIPQMGQAGLASALSGMAIRRGLGEMHSRSMAGPTGLAAGADYTDMPGMGYQDQGAITNRGGQLSEEMVQQHQAMKDAQGLVGSGAGALGTQAGFNQMTGGALGGTQYGSLQLGAMEEAAGQYGGAGSSSSPMAGGAGMAAGMLTSYLMNRYTDAPAGASDVAGGAVGGGVSGGISGAGGGGAAASTGSTGASGAAIGAAGGAIAGGSLAVIGYVASKIISKHVFGQGKQSGKDVGAIQFAKQYAGVGGKEARAKGFGSADEMLAAPYAWMTEAGRSARAEGGDVALQYQSPDYKPTKWEAWVGGMKDSGFKMKDIYDATAYYSSELGSNERKKASKAYNKGEEWYMNPANDRPTFVVDQMGVSKGKGNVKKVSSPYNQRYVDYKKRHGGEGTTRVIGTSGGEGGNEMTRWTPSPDSELGKIQSQYDAEMAKIRSGEGLWTDEQRAEQWKNVQSDYEKARLPWEGEGFNKAYEESYGHMKEYNAKEARRENKISKPGRLGWYQRHHGNVEGTLMHKKAQAEYRTGLKKDTYGKGISIPTTAKVGDRFARMGVTMNPETRDLYGTNPLDNRYDPNAYKWGGTGKYASEEEVQGLVKKTKFDYEKDRMRKKGLEWGVTGNTGGEGGHDIMGWTDGDGG